MPSCGALAIVKTELEPAGVVAIASGAGVEDARTIENVFVVELDRVEDLRRPLALAGCTHVLPRRFELEALRPM